MEYSKKLFAGPFVGEFGWELFCWQGILRVLSKQYKSTTIVCRKGHSILYKDFADKILEYSPQKYVPDVFHNINGITKDYPTPPDSSYFYIGPNTQITYYHASSKQYSPNYPQEHIVYGVNSINPKFDVLIHARNTNKVNTQVRNWDEQKWEEIVKYLISKNYSIGSIGTVNSSFHIKNTTDLRGIPLELLNQHLNNSKFVIGPSSGPLHLGALCNTNVIVWSGAPENDFRYKSAWNPHNVNVYSNHTSWDPTVNQVINLIEEYDISNRR